MLDHMVGFGDLAESLAVVTGLSARRLARTLAQAADPRRLLQTIAGRRLGTVRAVQSEPTLQLGDPRLQSRVLRRKRLSQRNKLFPRGLDRQLASHPILESEPESPVEKNLPQPKIRSKPSELGSYHKSSIPYSSNLRIAKLGVKPTKLTEPRAEHLDVPAKSGRQREPRLGERAQEGVGHLTGEGPFPTSANRIKVVRHRR